MTRLKTLADALLAIEKGDTQPLSIFEKGGIRHYALSDDEYIFFQILLKLLQQ